MASIKQTPSAKGNSDSLLNERWKLAVLLGVPAALIGGVLAYRYLKNRKPKGDNSETTNASQRASGTAAPATVRSEKPLESTVQPGIGPRKVDSAASLRSDEADDDDPLKSPVERAVTLKNRGNKFYKAGKFDRAIEYYSRAIALFETSPAEDGEGSNNTQAKQKGALEEVNYSDKEKDDVAILFQNRAAAFEQLGERAKALTDCDSALRWNKRYAKALLRRSHLLKDADRLYDAFLDATAVCILERFAVQSNVVESDTLLKQVALSNARRTFAATDRSCPFPSRAFIRSYLQAFHNDVVVSDAHARRDKQPQVQPQEATQPAANAYERILDSLNAEEYETTDRLCTEFLRENTGEPAVTSNTENDAEVAALQSHLTIAKVQLLKATFTLLRGAARPSIAELQIVTDLLAAVDDRAIRLIERLPADSHEALINVHTARLTVTLLRINAALKRAGASLQAGESDEAERAFRDAESALGVAKKVRKNADRELTDARNVLTDQHAAVARFVELATSCVDAHSDLYHQRAEYLLMSDRLPDALADFDRALEVRPRDSVVQSQRAFSAYRMASAQRDYEGIKSAMRSLDKLAKEHPGCAETASLGAQVHYDAARFDEADTLFARAIAIEPDNPSNYVHRGLLALRRIEAEMMLGGAPPSGEPTAVRDAERFFDSSLRVDANCQFALEALGSLELQRGNVARAVELFDRAISSARSEQEMTHLFELREAADVHRAVRERYGVSIDPAALLAAAQAQSFEVPPD